MSRDICIACQGNGKCADCDGTGINTHVSQDEPKCSKCSGTGVCPVCQGSGRAFSLERELLDIGLDKL